MKYQAYSCTSPRKQECEDSYAANPAAGLFAVFDGVTPMSKYRNESGHKGAFIAANLFKRYFEQLADVVDVREELVNANRLLKEDMIENQQWDLSQKHLLWSTCGIVARIIGDEVHIAQVGDCMALAANQQGEVTLLTKDSVEDISKRAMEKWEADRKKGLDVPDINTDYEKHAYFRSLANSPEGYSVANGMDEMGEYIFTLKLHKDTLKYLLIVSDGMFHPEERPEDLLSQILENGFATYTERLEKFELGGGRRPDDKTAILLEFE